MIEPSSPTPPMTPDMTAQHPATFQTKDTPIPAPLPSQQKRSVRGQLLSWTGLQGKTFWDWLSIVLIPIILAIYTLITTINMAEQQNSIAKQQTTIMQQQNEIADKNMKHQNEIADNQLKSQILQDYTVLIQDLILHEGLLQSKPGDNVQIMARTQTDLAFRQLDKNRKAYLLLFISRLNLTDAANPFIDLEQLNFSGADLSGTDLYRANLSSGVHLDGANLSGAYLHRANLGGAHLDGANLSRAYLSEANLSRANLGRANLSETNLSNTNLGGTNLSGADLSGTDLSRANLREADLREADLRGAKVTDEQLKQAKSLQGATMPDGSIHS